VVLSSKIAKAILYACMCTTKENDYILIM